MVRLHSGPVEPAHALPVSSVLPLESDACAVPPAAEDARKSVHSTSIPSSAFAICRFVHLYFESEASIFSHVSSAMIRPLHEHGLYFDDVSSLMARRLLLVHLLNGMCAFSKGPGCAVLHGREMVALQRGFVDTITEHHQLGLISVFAMRESCTALG